MKHHASICILWSICLFFALSTYSLILSERHLLSDTLRARALDNPLLPRGEKRKKLGPAPPNPSERRASLRAQGLPPPDTTNPTTPQSRAQSPASSDGRARQRHRQGSPQAQGLPQAQGSTRSRSVSPIQGLLQQGTGSDSRIQLIPHSQSAAVGQGGYLSGTAGMQLIRQQAGLSPAGSQNVQVCYETWSYACRLTYVRAAIRNPAQPSNIQHPQLTQLNIRPPAINIQQATENRAGSGSAMFRWPNMPPSYWQAPTPGIRQPIVQQLTPSQAQLILHHRAQQALQASSAHIHPFQRMHHGGVSGLQQAGHQVPMLGGASHTFPRHNYQLPQHLAERFMQERDQMPGIVRPATGITYEQRVNQVAHDVRTIQNIAGGSYNAQNSGAIHNQGRAFLINGQAQQHNLLGGGPLHFHDSPPREQTFRDTPPVGPSEAQMRHLAHGGESPANPNQAWGSEFDLRLPVNRLQRQASGLGEDGVLHLGHQAQPQTLGGDALHFGGNGAQSHNERAIHLTPDRIASHATILNRYSHNIAQSRLRVGSDTAQPNPFQIPRQDSDPRLSLFGNSMVQNQPLGGVGDNLRGGQTAYQIARMQPHDLRRHSSQGENLAAQLDSNFRGNSSQRQNTNQQRNANQGKGKDKTA